MMNKLNISVTFILATIVLIQCISTPLIWMDYNMRKDFYAEVLCVNKNRTDLPQVCGGRCQLKSKLADATSPESESSSKENKLKEVVSEPLSLSIFMFSTKSVHRSIDQLPMLIDEKVEGNYTSSIFHPPIA
ncbi:hypothetical protein [Flammeovirga agarivorans]|uniref:Uncharacterized protein n=1 Tax=Flammeovirga agarivorans TaxID=2726742 RepID=A0A7X8SJA5_9BACT|nr:hypothetical protein [Flammeovirga agarivorans]NLR91162.1 hypothetical protein [Flammeovirga agarivorans]